ncbi:MAG: hypothetical protein LH615_04410, partial [Ferruginibacter sp.]|nr:hypothetical protein [Ferruginibacter sp.]
MKSTCKIPYFLFTLLLVTATNIALAQMQFVQNKGQWDNNVNYRGDFKTGSFFLEKNGFTVLLHKPEDVKKMGAVRHGGNAKVINSSTKDSLHSHTYKVSFKASNSNPTFLPEKIQPSYNNYFIGNDRSKWAGDCKIYTAITYKNIYPNIDVRYYSTADKLKYDFIVHPGGNPAMIALQYDGADFIITKNNELIIGTSIGEVKELAPYSYQTGLAGSSNINTKYVVKNNTVTFNIEKYDPTQTLIIDPQLIFSSFTGSTADNWGYTATPGPDGSFFAGGITFGTGFPVSTGAYQTAFSAGSYDISILKFSPDGRQRLYATYIGGSAEEQPHSMIADANGNLIIAGRTNSPNYPLLTTIPATGSNYDIVLTKLNTTGTAIIGSAKIGGSGNDGINIKDKNDYTGATGDTSIRRNYGDDARSEVILDNLNNVILVSYTQSTNFPTVAALQPTSGGVQDGVILKLTPNLSSIIFSTYYGGSGDDACFVAAINPITGNLYVGGATTS